MSTAAGDGGVAGLVRGQIGRGAGARTARVDAAELAGRVRSGAAIGLQHWQDAQRAARYVAQEVAEIEEIDSGLLTGDLPIKAYLDEVCELDDPRSRGKGLTGDLAGYWRYRIGDYRVLVEVRDDVVWALGYEP